MRIAKREQVEFQVHLDDIEQYFGNDKLVLQIEQNTLRYVNLCSNAIDAAMPQVRSLPMNQRDTLDELAGTPGSNVRGLSVSAWIHTLESSEGIDAALRTAIYSASEVYG